MATNDLYVPRWLGRWILLGLASGVWASGFAWGQQARRAAPSIVHMVRAGEKLEMVVNTSRILTLEQRIPQVQVHNPDLVTATPLSPNQIQISARKTGVTQVNLWDEQNQIYTIDVVVVGDARELQELLSSEFPGASIKVRPVANGALISGYVDRPEDLERIRQLAEEYYSKVILNVTVGGVQEVLLHIKVMEVSRSKIRTLGFDFAQVSSGNLNTLLRSGISGLIGTLDQQGRLPISTDSTLQFGIVSGSNVFLGVLEALCQADVAKVVAEPTLVAVSGRPAYFKVGGEIPFTVSQGLGAVEIAWKDYGTRVDFVPIVLGNGRVRLELRPKVSEVDSTRTAVQGVPAIKESIVDTAVELGAGQTLAIAGLVQTRSEARKTGLPWVSDVPYLGALFRRVHEEKNEIETLILVTPEFVDAINPEEVPQCGPGMRTASPGDWELFMEGHIEVPNPCPPCNHGWLPASGVPGDDPTDALDPAAPSAGSRLSPPWEDPAAATRPAARSSPPASRQPPYSPARTPAGTRTPAVSQLAPRPTSSRSRETPGGLPGFMGPIGYDLTQ
ncbi:MAG: pilus assembly protein N-terminal domain-containing protein [Thermoguttaceae bacterium]